MQPSSSRPDLQLRPRKDPPARRLEIPLRRRPRAYVPGTGPRLQPISLLPPQDSTAYIIERILLPPKGLAADGKPLPKRMTYIVGWRDLPAARHLVPAMNILEYVSPRALEQWESDMEAELDQDRRRLADEKHVIERKGRPPAHTEIESATVAEPDSGTPSRMKMGAMSLSTPHKTRMEDFEGLSDEESGGPSKQTTRAGGWYMTSDFDDETPANGKQPGSDIGWGPSRLNAGAANGTLGGAHVPASTLASRPALDLASTQTPTGSSSRPRSLSKGPLGAKPTPIATGGFTPYNGFSRRNETPTTTRRSREPPRPTCSTKKTGAKPRKPTKTSAKSEPVKSEPVVDESGEAAWVVKTLEDMAIYDVEGRGLVRYFQVRWEGDWPPNQNPTWEPEENIPPNMVRNFFKKGRKRKKARPAHGRTPKAAKPSLGIDMHYKSVSEAFAGEAADNDLGLHHHDDAAGDDSSDLFVVDEEQLRLANAATAGNGLRALVFGLR